MTHGLGNYVCPRIHPSRGDWQVERLASGASHEQGNGEDAFAPGSHNGLPDISCEVDVTQDQVYILGLLFKRLPILWATRPDQTTCQGLFVRDLLTKCCVRVLDTDAMYITS